MIEYKQCSNTNKYKEKYCNLILEMEDQVNHLITQLKLHNLYDNTLVIYTSDNGGMVNFNTEGEEPVWPASYGQNYPFRGSKTTLFEGGTRVTSFITGGLIPKISRGSEYSNLSHAVDLHSLILKVSESQSNRDIDGIDIWDLIFNNSCSIIRNELPLNIIDSGTSFSSIIYENYKLITGSPWLFPQTDGWWNESHESPPIHEEEYFLFDIVQDPFERNELNISQNRVLVNKLLHKIKDYIRSEYKEPQPNVINPRSLPKYYNNVWYPFEK